MTGSYDDLKRGFLLLSGIDLNSYRESQMRRRIDSFIQREGYGNYNEFLKGMRQSRALLHSFISYLMIHVSEFCRNPEQWKLFEKKIIPLLKKNKNSKIKIWSAACSTGEEPYTIAMYMAGSFLSGQYQILATDIDMDAVQTAERGIYSNKAIEHLSSDFKTRYFKTVDAKNCAVKRNIISQVEFKKHNLLSPFYPSGFDFISCRNVTVYFTPEAKQQVYQRFSEALKPGGILFIGSSEQIPHPEQYGFQVYDTFFYRKTGIQEN